ncbi:MAG: helix-turn-helix transcriptional regulator [Solimonas sp.]
MRRADRLFQIVQYLRGRRLTTAAQLASWLQVSERTVYRDIRDLATSGVPVQSEAGVGYRMAPHFDLPPLMFTREEIESLAGGLRMVQAWGSPELKRGAGSAWAKLAAALPETQRIELERTRLFAPAFAVRNVGVLIDTLRHAIAGRQVLRLDYRDVQGQATEREVWPLGLYFWGEVWSLGAWCALRNDFRSFRVDRIVTAGADGKQFPDEAGRRLEDYVRKVEMN